MRSTYEVSSAHFIGGEIMDFLAKETGCMYDHQDSGITMTIHEDVTHTFRLTCSIALTFREVELYWQPCEVEYSVYFE